jgi:hypothetical protein
MPAMPTQNFPYNPVVGWLCAVAWGGAIIFVLFIATSVPEFENWIYLLPLVVFSGIFLVYFYYKYLIPVLNEKTALELDGEKLKFLIIKRTIYWKDVADIRLESYRNLSTINFVMLNGSKDIAISLKWIKGNNTDIFNAVVAYYNNSHP